MRLTNLTIENFKCFGQRQDLDLGRLTILTGANSSGKSSLMYSILGAIQSGEFPLEFSTNGKYVNMGDFQDIAFQRRKDARVKIAFTFTSKRLVMFKKFSEMQIESTWIESEVTGLPTLDEIVIAGDFFRVSVTKDTEKGYILSSQFNPNKFPSISHPFEALIEELLGKAPSQGFKIMSIDTLKRQHWSEDNDLNILVRFLRGYPRMTVSDFDNRINFISSFRLHPERTYLETTKNELKVERFGENYLDQIIAWETKKAPQFETLLSMMKELDLLTGIKASRMYGGRYEITVQSKENGVFTSLADVGFGVSQFLPILVADLQLPNDSTLFVAQPEIHLHPDIQSRFGEFLIKQVERTEKNYVIETHSEYCLNRLRLGIVKGELQPEDIAVYYLNQAKHDPFDTDVHKITFTKSGEILGAPEDFFTTYQMDVMEIALHAE
ncbi:MAG: AAA family ATPase [Candidatus Kapabacteria bacterium]|jgi:predicted ATPase|nr:AAA family ATPase [Candidatus Kapabacteria bacterium]